MKHKLLSLLCLAASILPSKAITLIPGSNENPGNPPVDRGSFTYSSAVDQSGVPITDKDLITALPQVGSTTATISKASVQSLYAFTDSQVSVSWTAALHGDAFVTTKTHMEFSNPYDLRYEFESSYVGLVALDSQAFFITSLFAFDSDGAVVPFQQDNPINEKGPLLVDGHYSLSSSGILPANTLIVANQQTSLYGTTDAVATGFWNLKLSTVPDTGSTLAMLGTALLGIAFVRRRATASPC